MGESVITWLQDSAHNFQRTNECSCRVTLGTLESFGDSNIVSWVITWVELAWHKSKGLVHSLMHGCISGLNALLYDQCQRAAKAISDLWLQNHNPESGLPFLIGFCAAFFLSFRERSELLSEKTNGETLSEAEMGFEWQQWKLREMLSSDNNSVSCFC